jgi:YtxH-like protein
MKNMSGILKSLLQAGLYLVDQPERATRNVRDRVRDGINDASDRFSDIGDRLSDAGDRLTGQDNTLRYVLSFAAGVGLGVGVGILMAPDSGEETRRSVTNKLNEVGERIKNRGKDVLDYQTGT